MKNFLLRFLRFLVRCLFAVCFPGIAARCPSVVPSLSAPRRRERDDDAAQPTLHLRLRQLLEETHEFRYNVLAEVPEFRERDGQGPFRRITPLDFNTLSIRAIDAGIGVWQRDVVRLLHSSLLPSFHPLTDYMNRLPDWDGVDRVRPLGERVSTEAAWLCGFAVWLRALAAQWMGQPTATANDLVPLLVSRRQGLRKSTFCRLLMPPELADYYTDKFDLVGSAAPEPRLTKLGLINLDEFDRYTLRQHATLKNLLQLKHLCLRRAYRQELLSLPRMASFMATSNVKEVLVDRTGSRRFVCVEVTRPIDCSPVDHAQLFAQLRSEVLSGAPCYLDRASTRLQERANAAFRVASPLAECLSRYYRVPRTGEVGKWHTVTALYDRLRRRCPSAVRGVSLQAFGREVRSLGFSVSHRRCGNSLRVVER